MTIFEAIKVKQIRLWYHDMATIHTKLKRIKTLSESVIVLLLTSLLAF